MYEDNSIKCRTGNTKLTLYRQLLTFEIIHHPPSTFSTIHPAMTITSTMAPITTYSFFSNHVLLSGNPEISEDEIPWVCNLFFIVKLIRKICEKDNGAGLPFIDHFSFTLIVSRDRMEVAGKRNHLQKHPLFAFYGFLTD